MNNFSRIYSAISKSIGVSVFVSNFSVGVYSARNVIYDGDIVPIPVYGCISSFKATTGAITWPIYPLYYYKYGTNKGFADFITTTMCPAYKSSMKFGKYNKYPEQFEFVKESK